MTALKSCSVLVLVVLTLVLFAGQRDGVLEGTRVPPAFAEAQKSGKDRSMRVQYLEVVSTDVAATCSALGKLHGVEFGKPEAALGNARTATLKGGGRIGVRAPLREDEAPIVRPYLLVDDIEAASKAAEAAGAEFAMTATEIPGHGKFAIYFLGGIQYGLWEL